MRTGCFWASANPCLIKMVSVYLLPKVSFMDKFMRMSGGLERAFLRSYALRKGLRIRLSPVSLLLVCLLFGGWSVSAAKSDTEHGWASLSGWGNENNFKLNRTKKGELVTLTNNCFKLSFKTDSQLAEVNGINVWLCDPITAKSGQVCISTLDLNTSIEPLLFPETNQVPAAIQTICLDPGHGGHDTGGLSGNFMEKRYTLPLAEELAGQLEAAGFKVILTRTNDTFIELEDRPTLAKRQKADLFISLHFNIGPPGEAKGVEVYCLTPAKARSTNTGRWGHLSEISEWRPGTGSLSGNRYDNWNVLLAYQLQQSLVKNLSAEDRGVRRARFAVLRTAEMPAVLVEGGFLSDSGEQKRIADPKYRDQLAAAIVQGVLAYQHAIKS
jgi:N-acetylmuramoyl-L-alanine amidase